MRRFKWAAGTLAVAVAACLLCFTLAEAKKPDNPGGGGGGGGNDAAYTILDLPGPNHEADGGWSQTYAEQIADVAGNGPVYVLGKYFDGTNGSSYPPCVWTIDETGVAAVNISGLLDTPRDINSAGIIGGKKDERPALLLPNGQTVFLADASFRGGVWGLNNPDATGVFQAVGSVGPAGGLIGPVLWDLSIDGTVQQTTNLTDPGGQDFHALDIHDSEAMGGYVVNNGELVPAIASFDGEGQLQISLRPNPSPTEIEGFWEFQIDDGANLLGFGYQLVDVDGFTAFCSRAVIWPSGGGAIDLSAETRNTSTEGNGIALVGGVMQVVGRAENDGSGPFAYLYTNNKMSDLGRVSKGDQPWMFDRAEGVNTAGMICGVGTVGSRKNRQLHGFLLIPTAP